MPDSITPIWKLEVYLATGGTHRCQQIADQRLCASDLGFTYFQRAVMHTNARGS